MGDVTLEVLGQLLGHLFKVTLVVLATIIAASQGRIMICYSESVMYDALMIEFISCY